MFISKIIKISTTIHQYKIYQNDQQLTYAQVIELWKRDVDFRQFYNQLLADNKFEAYFWENPPITTTTIQQPYEFVLVNSSRLTRIKASKRAFSKFFNQNKNGVVYFENLGKDAMLVVPSPLSKDSVYPHIAAFVRNAAKEQQQAFWQQVGEQVEQRLSHQKLWLSTSGLGVYWLHVRLDSRPKYYQYQSYK